MPILILSINQIFLMSNRFSLVGSGLPYAPQLPNGETLEQKGFDFKLTQLIFQ